MKSLEPLTWTAWVVWYQREHNCIAAFWFEMKFVDTIDNIDSNWHERVAQRAWCKRCKIYAVLFTLSIIPLLQWERWPSDSISSSCLSCNCCGKFEVSSWSWTDRWEGITSGSPTYLREAQRCLRAKQQLLCYVSNSAKNMIAEWKQIALGIVAEMPNPSPPQCNDAVSLSVPPFINLPIF